MGCIIWPRGGVEASSTRIGKCASVLRDQCGLLSWEPKAAMPFVSTGLLEALSGPAHQIRGRLPLFLALLDGSTSDSESSLEVRGEMGL